MVYETGGQKFCVSSGLQWGIGSFSATKLAAMNGTGVPTDADIKTIQSAMGNAGFGGWTAMRNYNVPEPGWFLVVALGFGTFWLTRRRFAA